MWRGVGGVEGVCRTWGQRGLCMPMRRSGPGADLVGQEAALAGGFGGVGLGRAIMALGGVGQLGCEGGGLGRAGGVMLVSGRGEAQVGISGLLGQVLSSKGKVSMGRRREGYILIRALY